MSNITSTFLFILSLLRPYKFYILGLLIIELIWAINLSFKPYLIKIIVDSLNSDDFILFSTPPKSFLLFAIVSIIQVFIFRISDYLYAKMMPNLLKDTILCCFKSIHKIPYTYFKNNLGGSIACRINETADSLEWVFNIAIYRIVSRFLALIAAYIAIGFVVNRNLATFLVIAFLILTIFNFYLATKPYNLAKIHMLSYINLIGNLVDSISNMLSIILFSRKKYEYRYLRKKAIIEANNNQIVKLSILYIELGNALYLVIINLLCFIYSIYLYQKQQISIGDITFILFMTINISDILKNIERDILRFLENFGKCSETVSIIEVSKKTVYGKTKYPIEIKQGSIEFKEVNFGYAHNSFFFNNISCFIKNGQKVLLLGCSGSGKTTFIELILKLFTVNTGEILIDNQSINDVTQNSILKQISIIPQDPILFNRTIFENIACGKENSTKKEIIAAAKSALAHDYIINLPNGYNTLVGERGEKLSGGQRKLICVARVMLKNNKIIILDEFTSNLDIITKHQLKTIMKKFTQNKTVLSISHSIEEVIEADLILLFDKGNIVAKGAHEELIKHNEFYKKFCSGVI